MKEKSKSITLTILVIISLFVVGDLTNTLLYFIKNNEIRSILGNFIYLAVLIFIYKKEFKSGLEKLREGNIKKNIKTGLKYWGFGLIGMIVFNIIINFLIFDGSIANNEELVRETLLDSPIYGFMSAVVIAPFMEETIFRASLRRNISNIYAYSLTTGLIFGLAHALSGMTEMLDLIYILPYGALGVAFGMIYAKTDNIYTSIFIHGLHNFITILMLFLIVG